MNGWDAIWEKRVAPPPGAGSVTERLMAAGGLDSGFAHVSEPAWHAFVARMAARLGLEPGASVFEVGCGAGAFLHDLAAAGHPVAGIDRSPALVELAREAIPSGEFAVADAADVAAEPRFDAVVSFGVFMYFPSLEYAGGVLRRMVAKARGAVAILDVPDAAREADVLAYRQERAGGPEAYARRYAGLGHRYYDRAWIAAALTRAGLVDVVVADQDLEGYGNAPFRYNVWGFVA